MSKLWKKATFPTIDEIAKEIAIKKRLTVELGRSIRQLQLENVDKGEVVYGGDHISNVCAALEAAFIHGLKENLSSKVTSVFRATSTDVPEPQFWPLVLAYSHKDVLSRITSLEQIVTDVGRCRAWLRTALNDGIICSYIDTLINDKSALQRYYKAVAYMRDREEPDIMRQLLEGLSVFTFQLSCNNSTLNSWNNVPLVLAGIWTPPPVAPQPVMPAVDVMEFFTEKHVDVKELGPAYPVESAKDVSTDAECSVEAEMPCVESAELNNEDISENEATEPELQLCSTPVKTDDASGGNKISVESGWSSEFEEVTLTSKSSSETVKQNESYGSLWESYNKKKSTLVGTPDITDFMMPNTETQDEQKSDFEDVSSDSRSPVFDYEVIPRTCSFSSGNADERTAHLLSVIGKICPEQGLDTQGYQCRGCGCPIGMIYGKAHLCYYDGFSYCSDCHSSEECYIPARIIHNWDFKKYPVAKHTKIFLNDIETEPLLNIKVLNPLIYSAVEEMDQLRMLRIQLNFLRSYIFTCKESIAEELRKKIWPREYLYEHVHLYSVSDILQVLSGSLQQTLMKTITFAKKHVFSCQLCSLKGFICEICNNPKVIYPFDIDWTFHCDHCLAVYHAACRVAKKFCPKCERKRKREESIPSPDN